MKRLFTLLVALLATHAIHAQLNIIQLGHKIFPQNLSDIWGYVDSAGNEYALVGVRNGTSIVDVTDPYNPVELFFTPGPNSIWRDIKVWKHYAYVSNETGSGIKIIDLQYLPDSIQTWYWTGNNGVNFTSAHNVFIDEKGYLYVIGSDYGQGGAIIANVDSNPTNPVVETVYNLAYIHDLFARGDTMWSAEIFNGWFAAVDVSNKAPATLPLGSILATQTTPNTFTHNCWLSDDGRTLYTTDEQPNAFIGAFDVSDLNNIQELDRVQSNPGSMVIPHNVFVRGNFLIISYYRDGVVVIDATHPDNLIETGFYDTSPLSGDGFNGCWGVYPYLPSGNILASDIENGLFILRPTYTQACYLEGHVRDSSTYAPLNGVMVSIAGYPDAQTATNPLGAYKTGLADSGTYQVLFQKLGYLPKTITVNLQNGITSVVDVDLVPLVPFTYSGQVVDSLTGQGLDHAVVMLQTGLATYTAITDTLGNFTFSNIYEDTYDLYTGRWDHVTGHKGNLTLNASSAPLTIRLKKGYYDDFLFDFGWTVSGNATTGMWTRDLPKGTKLYNFIPANPGEDVAGDFGKECFVTGNGGGGVGTDDIDNGYTLVSSPLMDLSAYQDPILRFDRWFFNAGGAGNPNDSLRIWIEDSSGTYPLDLAVNGDPGESQWVTKHYRLNNYLIPGPNTSLKVYAADRNPGHLVEAGFDFFQIYDSIYPPVAHFEALPDSGCQPLTVQFHDLSDNQPVSWQWILPGSVSGGSSQQNPLVVYDTSGIFNVTLIVSNSSGSDTLTLAGLITVWEQPEIKLSFTPDSGGGNGSATATVTGGLPPYLYQWNDPAQQTTPTASGLPAGTYHVTVTDQKGCTATDTVTIPLNTGLPDGRPGIFTLSPNPASDHLRITWSGQQSLKNWTIEIFDPAGRLVFMQKAGMPRNHWVLNPDLAAGMYTIRINAEGVNSWQKQISIIR